MTYNRPSGAYTPTTSVTNTTKYQDDSAQTAPKVPISSQKIDGEFNYLIDAVNLNKAAIDAAVIAGLPTLTGNANKAITTDGSTVSWNFLGFENFAGANSVLFGTDASGNGDEVTVGTGLSFTSSTLAIAAAGVDTTQLADSAVETAKIADLNVTTDKIADDAVTLAKIASGSNNILVGTDGSGNPSEITAGNGFNVTSGVASLIYADQATAEAGTNTTDAMTPLRTKQAIDAVSSGNVLATGTADGPISLPSGYSKFDLIISDVQVDTANTAIQLSMYGDGGTTLRSGEHYSVVTQQGTSGLISDNSISTDQWILNRAADLDNDTFDFLGASVEINNPRNSLIRTQFNFFGHVSLGTASAISSMWSSRGSGFIGAAYEDDTVVISPSVGNITNINWILIGYR